MVKTLQGIIGPQSGEEVKLSGLCEPLYTPLHPEMIFNHVQPTRVT